MPEKRETAQPSALGALKSTEGITKSLATLAGLYVAYRAASAVSDYFGGAKEEIDETERNLDKARKNFVETQIEQDKKDSQAIDQQIRDAFTERERNKVRFRPKSVHGHWEGQVFIPSGSQAPKSKK